MATKHLDHQKLIDLQPAHGLWQLYRPEKAPQRFRPQTLQEAKQWQTETRQKLVQTLGFQTLPPTPLEPVVIETVDKGQYIREKFLLRTSANSLMPVYILTPKSGQRPFPVVLALHGHGYGVKDIVGLWEDGEERNTPDGYHQDFAVTLCLRGLAVAAPEISCFGERQTDFSYLTTGQTEPTTCAHTAMLAFHLGGSVAGLRVHDGQRLVDYLETRQDMDVTRLGAMGISGGGMHTFFSACVKDVYQVFNAESQLETDFFEGRHRINGKQAYDFLIKKLRPDIAG